MLTTYPVAPLRRPLGLPSALSRPSLERPGHAQGVDSLDEGRRELGGVCADAKFRRIEGHALGHALGAAPCLGSCLGCATRVGRPMPAQCAFDAAMYMVGIVSPRKYCTKLRYQCECCHKVGSVRSDWEQKCGEKYGVLDICMLVMVN